MEKGKERIKKLVKHLEDGLITEDEMMCGIAEIVNEYMEQFADQFKAYYGMNK